MSTIATETSSVGGNPRRASRNRRRPGGVDNASRPTFNTPMAGQNSKFADKSVSKDRSNTVVVHKLDPDVAAIAPSPTESGSMEVCWICAEPVKYYALSACNHRTCHVCSLRLRALYKNTECTFCKEKQEQLIFTKSSDSQFESFALEEIVLKDAKLSIYFESQDIMEVSFLLLRFNCPEEDCDYFGNGWGDLRLHTRATHDKFMCDLCIQHKKIFSHEHILYPLKNLYIHLPSMNYRRYRTASKEPANAGVHPLCEFCRECFFGDDELHTHMRERHEECFVCKRNGVTQHFINYHALESHFHSAHFPCTHPDCLARKFVVFDTPIDLQAHIVDEHSAEMSSKDRKDARRVQADFAFQSTARPSRRDDERDHDRDTPPQQQPTQASGSNIPAARPPPTNTRRRDAFGAALTNVEQDVRSASPQVPEADVAVSERHAAFLAQVEAVSSKRPAGVRAVEAATRSYRAAESSARDLILTIWTVLDDNLENTASIIDAFVDLVEEEEKKRDILLSWKGFIVEQRRQFPELVPTSIGSNYAGIASGRVLKVKNSTKARSSQSVWNRVAMAAGSSSAPSSSNTAPRAQECFPPLASASSSKGRTAGQKSTPWASSSVAAPSVRPPPISNVHSVVRTTLPKPSMPKPRLSNAHFPELPTPSVARERPQVSGNATLKTILGHNSVPINAWGGNGHSSSGSGERAMSAESRASGQPSDESSSPGKGKKTKGKQKQKQTLFTMGALPTA